MKNERERDKSLLPSYPLDRRNDRPCDNPSDESPAAPFAKEWLAIVNKILPNFRFRYLAKGSRPEGLLALYQERTTGAYLLVRIADFLSMGNAQTPLPVAYAAQKKFEEKLGKLVPRVHFANVVAHNDRVVYIIGTDPAQGVIQDLFDDPKVTVDKQDLARELVLLLKKLKAKNLKHGDCHFENITYRMTSNGKKIDFLGLIDFEGSGEYGEPSSDVASVLTHAQYFDMIPDLVRAGLRIPEWFIEIVKSSRGNFDVDERVSRLIKRNSKPPYERLKMPRIDLDSYAR